MNAFSWFRRSKRPALPAPLSIQAIERLEATRQAGEARDQQLALLTDAVIRLSEGNQRIRAALDALANSNAQITPEERYAEAHRLSEAARIDDEFIRAFQEGFDSAERRKQALKARGRQMDLERRARYVAFF